MNQIITLTFSPAIDKSTSVAQLIAEKKLSCSTPNFEPGGGGINVARAMNRLGANALAVYFAGGHSGKYFQELLAMENIPQQCIQTLTHTRENLVVMETSSNQQYRFGMPAPQLSAIELTNCLTAIERVEKFSFLVVSGSMPANLPANIFPRLSAIAQQKGAKLVVDTSGEPLQQALYAGVYLIKPNLRELASLNGTKLQTENAIVDSAHRLIGNGYCEVVLVSMAQKGAILVTDQAVLKLRPPAVKVKSTVGAGDSMLAGMVLSLSKDQTLANALRYAIACGTAATLNPGTELCHPHDVEKLLVQLQEPMVIR